MASGYGAFGGKSQCYRFWQGFQQCRLHASAPVMCLLEQADYQECLHREKLKRRIAIKAIELKALNEGPADDHGHGKH